MLFYRSVCRDVGNCAGVCKARVVSRNCTRLFGIAAADLCTQRLHSRRNNSTLTVMDGKKAFERLPKYVVPKHYDITLKPDLIKFRFDGEETVNVEVRKPTSKIILNAFELSIEKVKYISSSSQDIVCNRIELSETDETASFHFDSELPTGSGQLHVTFTGILNDKMKGFYRNKYSTPSGETRYGASTQFEATDARRAFPCWDEPAIKATFDVTLIAPKDLVTLSNMNSISRKPHTGDSSCVEIKFDRTPVMSTYLLAFIVGEYDYVVDKTVDGVDVRVYTPVGKKEQGNFGLHVATKVLPYYKDYFKVEYPLPKLDLVAISDFSAGAMENWGLVTYRETCLLVDPENSSASRKQTVALVVGHEIAHQWFGNIVTMEWWTHLWLKEGFASWIEFLCVDYLFPEYDIWTQFVSTMLIQALELDSLRNSHPIEVPVGHPSEVDEIFDDISYRKGACVIRMLHSYIGDDDFRKGLNGYLTKHKYGNTFTEDLWDALEAASGKPVRAVMSTWTRQMGYPVIKVNIRENGGKRIVLLSQEKFLADGKLEDDSSTWVVPITVSIGPKKTQQIILDKKSAELTIDGVEPGEYIKLNPGCVGFYRCQYTPETLQSFLPAIKAKTLPPLDRLGLQNDLFALVQAGQTSTVEILKLLEAFVDEDNYTVWSSICNCLGKIGVLLSHTDYGDLFKDYGRNLLAGVSRRLGWDLQKDEGHLDTMLRSLILDRMGAYGDEGTVAEAELRFKKHVDKSQILPADLRGAVYRSVMSVGDEKTFEVFLKLYRETDLQEEKNRLSTALGALKNEALLQRVLKFAMSDEVRSQDTVFVIVAVSFNRYGRELAWQFFKKNWAELLKRYDGSYLLARLIKCLTENFASEEKAKEVEAFFMEHPIPGSERNVQQSLESIRLNAKWLTRDSERIRQFLASRK